jgi:hypothetical protein
MNSEPTLPNVVDPTFPQLDLPLTATDKRIIEKLNSATGLGWAPQKKSIDTLNGKKEIAEFVAYLDTRADVFTLEQVLSRLGQQPKEEPEMGSMAGISLTRERASKIASDPKLQREIHAGLKNAGFNLGNFIG